MGVKAFRSSLDKAYDPVRRVSLQTLGLHARLPTEVCLEPDITTAREGGTSMGNGGTVLARSLVRAEGTRCPLIAAHGPRF